MDSKELIKEIILDGTKEEKKFLFGFDATTPKKTVLNKFKVYARGMYPRYFKGESAPFHDEMVLNYIDSYYGENYLNIAFRGSAKTSIMKLFVTFVLLNDGDKHRNYIKVLTKDGKNSKQIVTDIYNLMVEVKDIYGDVFEREGDTKREETMGSFTMKNGRKLSSGTVGQTQRGHVQDAYRPDWIWFDDIEDRDSVRSLTITDGIIEKTQEAIDGLAKDGSYTCTANYISEEGVVEWMKTKPSVNTMITPILIDGIPTWAYYSTADIAKIKADADDFAGEYMCDPQSSDNKFFSVEQVKADLELCREPSKVIVGAKYWGSYLPHHRYGIGADTSAGVGLDSNTYVLWDFKTGEAMATYHNNTIAPDIFGHELMRIGREFGECIIGPERNNTGYATLTAMDGYPNIYQERTMGKQVQGVTNQLGWHTNRKSKPTMFFEFRKDYTDGLIKIYDSDLLQEMLRYTASDMQNVTQSSVTRHFDLLTAAVIGWQMKSYAGQPQNINKIRDRHMMRQRNMKNQAR